MPEPLEPALLDGPPLGPREGLATGGAGVGDEIAHTLAREKKKSKRLLYLAIGLVTFIIAFLLAVGAVTCPSRITMTGSACVVWLLC